MFWSILVASPLPVLWMTLGYGLQAAWPFPLAVAIGDSVTATVPLLWVVMICATFARPNGLFNRPLWLGRAAASAKAMRYYLMSIGLIVPLIMALILGRIGCVGKLYWFMPPSANLALRELGIVLFLAVVGLKSGGEFIETLARGDGVSWIGYGILITAIPLITMGILARLLAKMNYLTLCGMLAGSMTDPPALAFANNLHATSGAAALSYATVYPLVMFMRIITPQLLAVLFWGMG